MNIKFTYWFRPIIAAGVVAGGLALPQNSMAQTSGGASTPAAQNGSPAQADAAALAQYLANPAAFLAQDIPASELSALIASVALADPSVVASLEQAVSGSPAQASAVAQGLLAAATASQSDQQAAAFAAAAVRTDISTLDAVIAMATAGPPSRALEISTQLITITQNAIAAGADASRIATLVQATVVADARTLNQVIGLAVLAGLSPERVAAVDAAVGVGLARAATQLTRQGNVQAGAAIVAAVAQNGSAVLAAALNTELGGVSTAATTGQPAGPPPGQPAGPPAGSASIGGGGASPGGTPATQGGPSSGGSNGSNSNSGSSGSSGGSSSRSVSTTG